MRYVVLSSIILAVLLTPFAFFHVPVTQAQELSSGCQAVNSSIFDRMYYIGSISSAEFYAGDRISLSGNEPVRPPVTTGISLRINFVEVARDGFPGTLSYTIPTTGTYRVEWDATDGNSATWQASCVDGPAPEPAPGGASEGAPITSLAPTVIPFRYDGRLCYWDNHAVYTYGEKIDIYGIKDSRGFPVLNVTQAELDAVPGAEGVNTLVKATEDGEVQVYRLGTSNTYEVHAGLDWVRFTGLPGANRVCGAIDLP